MALLPPLPAEQWTDRTREALSGMLPATRRNPEGAGNALATLVRHPDLAEAFLDLNVHLLFRSTLPARLRELVILRVSELRSSPYESDSHVRISRLLGIPDDDIVAARHGKATDAFEHTVLAAVDELDETARLSDHTWAALGDQLDERQVMDFIFTVGTYSTLAMAFNTFGVELDQER